MRPDTAAGDPPLDVDRVDEVSVTVAFGKTPDGPPDEVFLLQSSPAGHPGSPWHEAPYVDVAAKVLAATGSPPAPHTFTTCRSHTSWGRTAARAEVLLSVALPGASTEASAATRDAVVEAFRRMTTATGVERGTPAPHDRALAAARRLVASVWSTVDEDDISVTDEEHQRGTHAWSFGLVTGERSRYQVTVGFLDGDPSTFHARRSTEPEVVDSVGV